MIDSITDLFLLRYFNRISILVLRFLQSSFMVLLCYNVYHPLYYSNEVPDICLQALTPTRYSTM